MKKIIVMLVCLLMVGGLIKVKAPENGTIEKIENRVATISVNDRVEKWMIEEKELFSEGDEVKMYADKMVHLATNIELEKDDWKLLDYTIGTIQKIQTGNGGCLFTIETDEDSFEWYNETLENFAPGDTVKVYEDRLEKTV